MRGIENYEHRLIHHSDKGTQYASDSYTARLEKYKIRISMCKEVYENTHIERVNDPIKNQYLKRMEITNNTELKEKLDEAIKAYNETRPHQSLKMMPPIVYENYLTKIKKENRNKMKVYTIKSDKDEYKGIQLNLFDSL